MFRCKREKIVLLIISNIRGGSSSGLLPLPAGNRVPVKKTGLPGGSASAISASLQQLRFDPNAEISAISAFSRFQEIREATKLTANRQ